MSYNNQPIYNAFWLLLTTGPGTPSFKRLIPHYSSTSKTLIKFETEIILTPV